MDFFEELSDEWTNDMGLQSIWFDIMERLQYSRSTKLVKGTIVFEAKKVVVRVISNQIFDAI